MYSALLMSPAHRFGVGPSKFFTAKLRDRTRFSYMSMPAASLASKPRATAMLTPEFLPPFDYTMAAFFSAWPTHPAGASAIALMTRLDNVALARDASDEGRQALDPLQEQLRDALPPAVLADPQFLRFLGHFMLRVMEQVGYELLQDQVPLPLHRQIVLKSAAVYRRAITQAA